MRERDREWSYECKDDLACDGQPPCDRSTDKAHAIVEIVGYHNADADKERLGGDETAPFMGFAELRLIHGNSRCFDT